MIEWMPCELHAHTRHSDGSMTLLELAESAKKLGIRCVALTDHNTISGHKDIRAVMRETDILIACGLEWTTFYGHMLLMGVRQYVDWKHVTPKNIDQGIDAVHAAGGLAGIAHPFRMGSPISTGCYWEFEVKDLSKLDYIEVWSGTFPSVNPMNHRAFQLWDQMLDKGYRIAGVSGRDWHSNSSEGVPLAVTYLGINQEDFADTEHAVTTALHSGRTISTLGPFLCMKIVTEYGVFGIGDVVELFANDNTIKVVVDVDFSARRNQWKMDCEGCKVVLKSNLGQIELEVSERSVSFELMKENLTWLRAQLYGKIHGNNCLVAFTNPVYFNINQETDLK